MLLSSGREAKQGSNHALHFRWGRNRPHEVALPSSGCEAKQGSDRALHRQWGRDRPHESSMTNSANKHLHSVTAWFDFTTCKAPFFEQESLLA